MNEDDATDTLENLGLSNYEAKVFVALQKLGTARDIHGVTDVPRSHVYGAAKDLQQRDLVEVQQWKPLQYRSVSLDAAKSHLRDRFERRQKQAFDYRNREKRVRGGRRGARRRVDGREAVSSRVEQLVEEAESRIIFGVHDASLFPETIADALREHAETGVDVLIVANDPAIRAASDSMNCRL